MESASESAAQRFSIPPWGDMPPYVDALLITGSSRLGRSLADALANDSATEVRLREAVGLTAGLACLRERAYDIVLVAHDSVELDAPAVLDAIHTASSDTQPIIVLGMAADQEVAALCYEAGADAYLCLRTTATRTLLWQIARARERRQLLRENEQLRIAQRQREAWEEDEAVRLLEQQRLLASTHAAELSSGAATQAFGEAIPWALRGDYIELLRAYVVMGSGHLGPTLEDWAERLAAYQPAAGTLLSMHLRAVTIVLEGLGGRGGRHIQNRADLLLVELLMRIADRFRKLAEHRFPHV
jgi:response regulator RpfG family c-di-GMP phosphodiesterase